MIVMENKTYQNSKDNSILLVGFGLLKFTEVSSGGKLEILFLKGIGIPLIQNVIELYKKDILEKRKGNSIISLDEFTVFIHFFEDNQEDILVIIYMDERETTINYTQLYRLTKKISGQIHSDTPLSEVIDFCDETIEIPKTDGLLAIFIIGASGSPYISKINKERSTIAKSEVHIGGFVSALFSFSKEIIGQESGAKLKEINFGNQRFYMITKSNVIFAYLVEKVNPLLERYMYLIAEDFLNEFKEYVINFSGDVSRFSSFHKTINQYFII